MTLAAKPAAISVDHLSKTYPVPFLRLKKFLRRKSKDPVEALRNISFDIAEGEIFGLIGPNGAGKTTLTKIIATLVQPTSGKVIVKGHDTVTDDQSVRSNVGLSGAEERSFYWRLTAEQNLLFFARLHGLSSRAAKDRISELFEMLELQELASRRFAELSTGNKQRMSVARAMLARPPVLLLDEPTRSLDPIAAARMQATIKSLAQRDVTIFLTSHNLTEVEELCDRVAIISKGEIRALDTPKNLRAAHTEEENVTILFTSLSLIDAEQALARSFQPDLFVFEQTPRAEETAARFRRSLDDELLDHVLRILQQSGAVIRSVESERATLLDVLERYESTEGN
jgi:ABC-2 type transport system ATP-binding protein